MSNPSLKNDSDDPRYTINHSVSSNDDIYGLLHFAEDIKKICDNYIEKLEDLIFRRNLIIVLVAFVIIIYNKIIIDEAARYFVFFSLLLLGTLLVLFTSARINKIKYKLYVEQNALTEAIDFMRESISLLQKDNNWTKIQEIEFKIINLVGFYN